MNNANQSNHQKEDLIFLFIILGVIACVCLICICIIASTSVSLFNSPSGDPFTFIPSTPTPAPAYCPKVPSDWTLEINETFDNNKKDWTVGLEYDDYGKTRQDIADGKYKIQASASATQGVYRQYKPLMPYKTYDFYLKADVRQVEGPLDSEYGIVFRNNASGDLYNFGITDNQEFFFDQWFTDDWFNLLPITYTPIVKPGEPNQLTVLAQGAHFSLCINRLLVAEIENDDIVVGKAGFAYSLFNEGDEAEFEFDNFRLYVPPTTE